MNRSTVEGIIKVRRSLSKIVATPLARFSDLLTIKDLQVIKNALWEARTEWKNIGDALGIDVETLKSIATKEHNNPDNCLRECLTEWLGGGSETSAAQRQPRSWRTIVSALKTQSVNRESLANKIEKNYCISQEQQPLHREQPCQEKILPSPKELQELSRKLS